MKRIRKENNHRLAPGFKQQLRFEDDTPENQRNDPYLQDWYARQCQDLFVASKRFGANAKTSS